MCPAGQVIGSDFPPACLDRGKWTPWFDRSNPSGSDGDDNELLKHLQHERPGEICEQPLYMQAQTVDEIPARESGDVFDIFDALRGLTCVGSRQESGRCQDYRVRFFCPTGSLSVAKIPKSVKADYEAGTVDWTPWFSIDDPVEVSKCQNSYFTLTLAGGLYGQNRMN